MDELLRPRRRCTKAELGRRIALVRLWIEREGTTYDTAVGRIVVRYGVSERQATRYWVQAQLALMSPEERYLAAHGRRPRGHDGRYRSWSCVSGRREAS